MQANYHPIEKRIYLEIGNDYQNYEWSFILSKNELINVVATYLKENNLQSRSKNGISGKQ